MNREQDLDRHLDATPYKVQEARKRGSVARSPDVQALAVLTTAAICLLAGAPGQIRRLATLVADGLGARPVPADDPAAVAGAMASQLISMLAVLAPDLLLLIVVVVVVGLAQTGGLIFAAEPITPDPTRLNPASGLKRLLSMRILYETAKSCLKLVALAMTA